MNRFGDILLCSLDSKVLQNPKDRSRHSGQSCRYYLSYAGSSQTCVFVKFSFSFAEKSPVLLSSEGLQHKNVQHKLIPLHCSYFSPHDNSNSVQGALSTVHQKTRVCCCVESRVVGAKGPRRLKKQLAFIVCGPQGRDVCVRP